MYEHRLPYCGAVLNCILYICNVRREQVKVLCRLRFAATILGVALANWHSRLDGIYIPTRLNLTLLEKGWESFTRQWEGAGGWEGKTGE